MTDAPNAIPQVALPLPSVMQAAAMLEAAGRRGMAATLAGHILQQYPNHARALHLSGLCAAADGRFADAAALIGKAIAQGGEDPQHYRNQCAVLERLGRLEEAEAAGRRAVELDPTDPQSYHNLTIAQARQLRLDAAIASARRMLSLDPEAPGAHMALAECLLLGGDFAEGWEEYEWRFRLPQAPPVLPRTDRPQWDGRQMRNGERLLIIADQGFGDVIQFARYIPWARERCADCVLAADQYMHPLLGKLADGMRVFGSWAECPPYDMYVPLSGLPRLYGTHAENIPFPMPYLVAEPVLAAAWRARLDALCPRGHRRVGLVWAGRPEHPNDRNRSAALSDLAPLFDVPGVTFVLLQKGPRLADAARLQVIAPIVNMGASIETFSDTAALAGALDLVVSVDTSVAHLAGALGMPVWLMLPFAPDWRWLLHREDTPWYPTARLFRQAAPGDWRGVAARVAEVLRSGGCA